MKKLGLSDTYEIDRYFLKKVKSSQKIIELENWDEQIQAWESLEDPRQLFQYTINNLAETESMLNLMTSAWQNGDSSILEKIFISDGLNKNPEILPVYEKLLFEPTQRMAGRIEEFLRTDQVYFIVIGAAHLLGEQGMIEILKKQGYRVEQM